MHSAQKSLLRRLLLKVTLDSLYYELFDFILKSLVAELNLCAFDL